jgi:hypothetical protein
MLPIKLKFTVWIDTAMPGPFGKCSIIKKNYEWEKLYLESQKTYALFFCPKLYIPFRSSRNGRKISYRYANQYEITPHSIQSCRYRFGLAIGMVYFGTGQYRPFVSGLPLYIYLLIYMFIHQNL